MTFPVLDLHCDTVLTLLGRGFAGNGSLRRNSGHIDLERGAALPGYAQCFAFFSSDWKNLPGGITVRDLFERALEHTESEIAKNSDLVAKARNAAEIENNRINGKISAIYTLEGTAFIGFDPAELERMHKIGICISSLSWNEKNPLTGSHVTGGGLTDRGREYVKEAQRLGIVIDTSHISDEAFWDIMDITEAPIVATHSNSRAMWDVSRNLTDDMFRAICRTGGVAGLNQYTDFIGEKPTLDTACDHIFHFLELDPDGTHVALGGDLDGCESLPAGFDGVQSYPALAQRLLQRGLDEKTVRNIFWNNALGVIERCCM